MLEGASMFPTASLFPQNRGVKPSSFLGSQQVVSVFSGTFARIAKLAR